MTRIGSPARPPAARPASSSTAAPEAPAQREAAARFEGRGQLSPADLPAAGTPGRALQLRLGAALGETGGERGMRPGVAELYARYDVGERMGRPRERVLTWAAFLQDFITAADPSRLAEVMLEKDMRRQTFLLEGILKLYRKEYPEVRPLFDEAKKIEDLLGDVKEPRDQLAAIAGKDVPPAARRALEERAARASRILEQHVAERWTPDAHGRIPAIATLMETLAGVEWADEGADRTYLARRLRRELKKIRERPYDMAQLQGKEGMHALRRDLRWFPIFIEALDGLVQLDDSRNPVAAYEPLLESDLARSRFVQLPDASLDAEPMLLSKSLYTANMKAVHDFGDLKDDREEIEGLAHALLECGEAADLEAAERAAAKMLGRAGDGDARLVAKGQVIFEELMDNRLVHFMRRDLREYR